MRVCVCAEVPTCLTGFQEGGCRQHTGQLGVGHALIR